MSVNPEMYRWARERSGIDPADLLIRFPKLTEWETLKRQPTLKQLEQYARATFTPIGLLLLPSPILELLPIPDFRTIESRRITRPSPNLLDTIYLCQQRQEWYREYAQEQGLAPLAFVGSVRIDLPVEQAADRIRASLKFEVEEQRAAPTWADALGQFIVQADAAGLMVMCSGVVGSNNRRALDPSEFRGFALADDLAPLIFINGADTKAAQMFTLAHELAHLALGQSGLSDVDIPTIAGNEVERWCNRVAAEMLVPLHVLRELLRPEEVVHAAMIRLAHHFKVSTLVILRRLLDVHRIAADEFGHLYRDEFDRLMGLRKAGTGGNFYLSQAARISRRFTRALVESTLEGHTLYRDAMRLAGVARIETLHELGRSVGVAV